eukprot:4668349-Prymnesium_polylepis.1
MVRSPTTRRRRRSSPASPARETGGRGALCTRTHLQRQPPCQPAPAPVAPFSARFQPRFSPVTVRAQPLPQAAAAAAA